jgi:hypothetical protein
MLSYGLDGKATLLHSRKEILVQPGENSEWLSYSRFPSFRIEVNVESPGEHILHFQLERGHAAIEKILATLFYSAEMKNGKLDMDGDPGRGRLGHMAKPWADGAMESYKSPEIRAKRRFYVDAEKGEDSNDGLSEPKSFKSLAKINTLALIPGDAVLLKRGCVWQEGLAPKGNGSEKAPISLGSWGEGERPVVDGGAHPGMLLTDQSYWVIQDIRFTSHPDYGQCAFEAAISENAPRPKSLKIYNCDGFDSGATGFQIGDKAGYDGVLVENCRAYANSNDGIAVDGDSQRSGRNAVIRHCTAYSDLGDAGIWISGGENGLIEDCLGYNDACVNIWAFNSVNITMRHCESFRGRPPRDAAGFDIDYGVQASTLEYCYSHDNEGDGVLLMGMGHGLYNGQPLHSRYNLMRYCITEGTSPLDMVETFEHGKVIQNLSVAWGAEARALRVGGWPDKSEPGKENQNTWMGGGWPKDTEILNNIFVALDGASLSIVDDHATEQNNRFDYNLYWRDKPEGPAFRWGGRENGPNFWQGDSKTGSIPPQTYSSLANYQKGSGAEAHGIYADPKLEDASSGEYGRFPLEGPKLKPGSPARAAAPRLALEESWLKARAELLTETGAEAWGIPMQPAQAKLDYWGNPIPSGKASIGPEDE